MLIPRRTASAPHPSAIAQPSASIAFWERYALAHPELDKNTNVGCARPSIDHGRLRTIERREKLAQLEAVLVVNEGVAGLLPATVRLENRELLSPRRIWRRIRSRAAVPIADELYSLIRDWVEAGYPAPNYPTNIKSFLAARTIYKSRIGAWSIYLTRKES